MHDGALRRSPLITPDRAIVPEVTPLSAKQWHIFHRRFFPSGCAGSSAQSAPMLAGIETIPMHFFSQRTIAPEIRLTREDNLAVVVVVLNYRYQRTSGFGNTARAGRIIASMHIVIE